MAKSNVLTSELSLLKQEGHDGVAHLSFPDYEV